MGESPLRKRGRGRASEIRGCNRSEADFVSWSEAKGATTLRAGWPDFLCRTHDGRIVAVEVKTGGDRLSERQVQMIELLEEAGIQTYVFYENRLHEWRKFQQIPRPGPEIGLATQPGGVDRRGEQSSPTSYPADLGGHRARCRGRNRIDPEKTGWAAASQSASGPELASASEPAPRVAGDTRRESSARPGR